MRLLFALPGFHRYERGAEVALLSIAEALAQGGSDVTVMGSGHERDGTAYRFRHVPSIPRERFERFPRIPPLPQRNGVGGCHFQRRIISGL